MEGKLLLLSVFQALYLKGFLSTQPLAIKERIP